MFHITNGDSVRDTIGHIPGESIVWCDILHHGPNPQGHAIGDRRWNEVRAAFHASLGFGGFEDCLAGLTAMDAALLAAPADDELVLWYEHDLFDQLILLRLLAHFAEHPSPPVISLVGLENFVSIPGFRGLGELSEAQMQIACQTRKTVSREQLSLASAAWKAFTAPSPVEIEKRLCQDTSALPYLAAALRRHLTEFPSTGNGLSHTEKLALEELQGGSKNGRELFRAVQNREEAPFLGDSTFFGLLCTLATEGRALLEAASEEPGAAEWQLTSLGEDVLAGRVDRVALNGIDTWRGGCHLHAGVSLWRWDPARESLVADDRAWPAGRPVMC